MSDSPVMLFDGKCVFCNGAVNFALAREQQPLLRFARDEARKIVEAAEAALAAEP